MEISRLLLADGSVLTSGEGQAAAIQSVTHTAMVNACEELTCGSVCAAVIRVSVWDAGGVLSVRAGEEVTCYRGDTPVGRFLLEKPERRGKLWQLTGYDRVILLDRDLTDWLSGLRGWPYPALEFARMVAGQCGLTLKNTNLLNGSYPIGRFAAQGITGRKLMEWLGQLSGSFCRATADGELEFAWYEDRFDLAVTPAQQHTPGSGYAVSYWDGHLTLESPALTVTGDGDVTVTGLVVVTDDGSGGLGLAVDDGARRGVPYAMGSLTLADYETAPISGVRLQLTDGDVGVTYPPDAWENLYRVTGNYLLTGAGLEAVAEGLYRKLRGISYTPCTFTVAADWGLKAGDRVTVAGKQVYLMESERRGGSVTFKSTGGQNRQSLAAANEESYKTVNGKFLTVSNTADALRLALQESDAHIARVEMDTGGLAASVGSVWQQVVQNQNTVNRQLSGVDCRLSGVTDTAAQNTRHIEQLKTRLAGLEQGAQGVGVQMRDILENGVSRVQTPMGNTLDDGGLRIRSPGGEMESRLDAGGMEVSRWGEVMLSAHSGGVLATDVTVRGYLAVGDHARFENYTDGTDTGRTGCFFL